MDQGTNLPAAVLIVMDPVGNRDAVPAHRFVWPIRHDATMAMWSGTDLNRPTGFRAIELGQTAYARTATVSPR